MQRRDAQRLRWVWYFWFAVVGIILIRGALQPHRSNCFPCYQKGGWNWHEGNDLYQAVADTCRYSPLVHAVFAPFSMLPDSIGATVWRLVESIALLLALNWWLKTAAPSSFSDRQRAWVLLLTVPTMMGNLNAGQSNALMMAGILVCVAAINQQRWAIAALALAFACYLKIYPLTLAMLLMVMYPSTFTRRFALALLAGALVPFLLKDADYVARQYGRWVDNLVDDDRSQWPIEAGFRDGWMLIRYFSIPMSFTGYRILTTVIGALIGIFVLVRCRRGDHGREFLNRVVGLGCCWMTVFGPATEGHTYILLVPTVALLTIECSSGCLPHWSRGPIYFSIGSFLLMVAVHATPLFHFPAAVLWMPLAALATLGTIVALIVHGGEQAASSPASKSPSFTPDLARQDRRDAA